MLRKLLGKQISTVYNSEKFTNKY